MFSPEVLWGLGVVVLLGVLIWGTTQYRYRNRANDRITEQATHELYKHPDTYEQRREQLKEGVKPS